MYVFQEHLLIVFLILLKRRKLPNNENGFTRNVQNKIFRNRICPTVKIDCTGSLKTAFRPVSHLVKTTCSLLVKTQK